MAKEDPSVFQNIKDFLQRDYRGINVSSPLHIIYKKKYKYLNKI